MLLLTLMVYSSTMVPVRLTVIMGCSRTECRVNLAYSIMTSLSWIWDAEWVSVLNMVRIYRALVSAVLLYAVETWGLTQLTVIDVQSLETAHQKCLETDTRDTLVRSYHQQRILITHRPGHCLTLPVCTTYCPLWTCCPTGQVHRGQRHTWLFNVTLTYHSTDFQIIHGVVARVILHQVVRSTFGTPSYYTLEDIWRSGICHGCGGATQRTSPATWLWWWWWEIAVHKLYSVICMLLPMTGSSLVLFA